MSAFVLGDEEPGDLSLHGRGHEYGSRLGSGLDARGDIGGVAEHFAGPLDYDGPCIEADAGRELRRALGGVSCVQLGEGALDGQRCPQRALGVVLLCCRPPVIAFTCSSKLASSASRERTSSAFGSMFDQHAVIRCAEELIGWIPYASADRAVS
jgi:hypothetical protein